MNTAFLFKEWIKLRKLAWIPLLLIVGALVDTWLSLRGLRTNHGPTQLWNALVYKQDVAFDKLAYALPLAGVWYGCVQYLPECAGKRLRLLFHLPTSHWRALYLPAAVGLALMALLSLLALGGLWAILTVAFAFPNELAGAMVETALPWTLAGAVAYLATAAVIAEPAALRRLAIALAAFAYVSMLTPIAGFAVMSASLGWYALLCLPWLLPLEAAAQRVKGGA